MKKLLALVLVISLLGVPFGAFAEGLNLEGVTSEGAVIDTTGTSDKLISKAASSTDKVEDIDGNLVVTTNFGVVLTCSVPSGVYALTQSYFHDIALYNSVYPDPAAIIEKFINDEMHLNLFTVTGSCLDVFFYVYEGTNSLGEMIGSANNLSDSDAATVAAYLAKVNDVDFEYGKVGDQVWFIANLIGSHNMLVAFTYVNGHCVQAYMYNIATNDDVQTAMNMLASVSFSTK